MKVQCVICCGQTQMTVLDGGFHLVALGIRLGRIFRRRSTTTMDSLLSPGHISLSWRVRRRIHLCSNYLSCFGVQVIAGVRIET